MGPLRGVRVVEIASFGPGPFAATLLADMGADIVKVDRVDEGDGGVFESRLLSRGRRSICVDLKLEEGVEIVLRLVGRANGLIEGFRPGVAERLGLGPASVMERNPRIVYGRMTGWGQSGPRSETAGHDIDYMALSGMLHAIGSVDGGPIPPLNLVGDYGGGGTLLAFGMVCAMFEATRSGRGQVVDASMVEGASLLGAQIFELLHEGLWEDRRGVNLLDGGAPFYTTYETADGRHVAVGALEPKFFRELLAGLELDSELLPSQYDRSRWPELRSQLAGRFITRTRDEWEELFAGTDACVAPVLSLAEAPRHPHNQARGTFVEQDGMVQPGPAPRFSNTVPERGRPAPGKGEHTADVLAQLGYSGAEVESLERRGIVR